MIKRKCIIKLYKNYTKIIQNYLKIIIYMYLKNKIYILLYGILRVQSDNKYSNE